MNVILLLRAINLGKLNKVPMLDLKTYLSELGYLDVHTLLQSGNVSVDTDKIDINDLENKLSERYGFKIPIILTSYEMLIKITEQTNFKENSMVVFTNHRITDNENKQLVQDITEEFQVFDQCIIINYTSSYHMTKFNNNWFERKLKINTTIRNRNTVLKMIESFK